MKEVLTSCQEQEIKDLFFTDNALSSREWVARYGHTIWCGDFRQYIFIDKDFEKWIHEVYEILFIEELSEVRKEILTPLGISIIEEEIKNMW